VHAACEFTSHEWIGSIDVPTAVVVTRNDRIVPPRRQWKLIDALPNGAAFAVDGSHDVFLSAAGRLAAVLLQACEFACGDDADYGDTAPTAS
jgi:pimeloyl-ACP methyl ester carboxylesterase